MRIICGILFVIVFTVTSCGSADKKKDLSIKSARTDSGITVKDSSFKFNGIKRIILYNEIEDEDSKAILSGIAEALKQKGIDAIIDIGESMEYKEENLRVKTYKTLMTVYYNVKILKPGGQKGNEEIIADIKADSIPKIIENTVNFILQE